MAIKREIRKSLYNLFISAFQSFSRVLLRRNAIDFFSKLVEDLSPTLIQKTSYGELTFFCPGIKTLYRAKTIFTKEPETIEWIDSFNPKDVLWDIGANIGVYSLYSAIKGVRVISFEPSPSNYYILCKNIELNKLDNKINTYPIALNEKSQLDFLFMKEPEPGGSSNNLGMATDWQGKKFAPAITQSVLSYTIDELIDRLEIPFPSHVKIDVDGNERKIINGSINTISDSRLESVLIELNTSNLHYIKNIIKIFEDAGLKYHSKVKIYSNIYNYIFWRSND